MSNIRSHGGTVEVDGAKYHWELLSEPRLSSGDGWIGMTVSLRQHDMPREAVLEFPTPKRVMRGLPKGRSHINDTIAARGVRSALLAGWDPTSRGKTMHFTVDANGD
ncbi:MAG: hypothetical protein ABW164_12140 [Sphingobium sp.]